VVDDNSKREQDRRDLFLIITGVLFSVLAQALYDIGKEYLLGDTNLEYVDLASAIFVIAIFYPIWMSVRRSGRKH
jgi:hypothetical protein